MSGYKRHVSTLRHRLVYQLSTFNSRSSQNYFFLSDGLKMLLWPDDITFELVNTLKELNYKINDKTVFADIVIATLSGASAMPVRVQSRHFETLIMFVLTVECLQKINESE